MKIYEKIKDVCMCKKSLNIENCLERLFEVRIFWKLPFTFPNLNQDCNDINRASQRRKFASWKSWFMIIWFSQILFLCQRFRASYHFDMRVTRVIDQIQINLAFQNFICFFMIPNIPAYLRFCNQRCTIKVCWSYQRVSSWYHVGIEYMLKFLYTH